MERVSSHESGATMGEQSEGIPVADIALEERADDAPEQSTDEQQLQANSDSPEHNIRDLAYQKWQAAGCPDCDGAEYWLDAEQQVLTVNR